MIEKIRNLIASYPGFEGIPFPVDSLGPLPGCGGVFPRGEEIISRVEDVVGGLRLRKRLTLELMLTSGRDPLGDGAAAHGLLLEFAAWAPGNCPALGERTVLKTKGPRMSHLTAEGVARHSLTLVVEYTV